MSFTASQDLRLPPSLRSSVGGPSRFVDDDVDVAVVVEVAEGAAASEVGFTNGRTGSSGHVGEASVAEIAIEESAADDR